MKPRRSSPALANAARAMLAACMLGLVLTPFGYIALGALGGLPPAFSALVLPPLLAGIVFLLVRLVRYPSWLRRGVLPWLAELFSWLVIATFLFIISGFNLQTGLERAGSLATLVLTASLLCLPLVLLRQTVAHDRLACVPDALVLPLALVLVPGAMALMGVFLVRPVAFL